MGKFILGVIVTLLILILGGLGFATLGFFPTHANVAPPRWEHHLANAAVDTSMERHAPHITNPLPPTPENLEDGMKLYTMNCAVCHGGLDRKRNVLGGAFYPPAPQILVDVLDDPEWHIFFAIKHGVRLTGMPAWGKVMGDDDLWKIVAFVKTINQLPPAVEQQRRLALGGSD